MTPEKPKPIYPDAEAAAVAIMRQTGGDFAGEWICNQVFSGQFPDSLCILSPMDDRMESSFCIFPPAGRTGSFLFQADRPNRASRGGFWQGGPL